MRDSRKTERVLGEKRRLYRSQRRGRKDSGVALDLDQGRTGEGNEFGMHFRRDWTTNEGGHFLKNTVLSPPGGQVRCTKKTKPVTYSKKAGMNLSGIGTSTTQKKGRQGARRNKEKKKGEKPRRRQGKGFITRPDSHYRVTSILHINLQLME